MQSPRITLVAAVTTMLALLTGCAHGPAGIPAVPAAAPASALSNEQSIMARAFDVRPSAAAEPAIFMMPSPDYFDDGYTPSVTFVKPGFLVEEHSSYKGYLWYHVGAIGVDTVNWREAQQYDDGVEPSVTGDGNGNGTVFEVHRSSASNDRLYYRTGKLQTGTKVQWNSSVAYSGGDEPAVASSGSDVVLEAHTDDTGLGQWNVFTIAGGKITWHRGGGFADGYHPSIAANAKRMAVEVERTNTKRGDYYPTFYRVGRIDPAKASVSWGPRQEIVHQLTLETGKFSSVALDDAGNVIYLYVCEWPSVYAGYGDGYGWCTVSGTLGSDNLIHWHEPFLHVLAPPMNYFVELHGLISPSVATLNGVAVGVAQQGNKGLYYATTMLTDRSNWIGDRLTTSLRNKTLRQIVVPASHDAGMYKGNALLSGVAQSQDFYDQLTGGQRYFDIRPDKALYAWHGPGQGYGVFVTGASVRSILDDVKRYMQEGHREVVVLKFSHWGGFTPAALAGNPYTKLLGMVVDTLGPWLYENKTGKRLADIPLSTLIPPDRGVVLPVMDLPEGFSSTGNSRVYAYRDWDSTIRTTGTDLTVYDQYTNTILLGKMQRDQLSKLAAFNGKMDYLPNVPCDLFLLSWTLTPAAAIRASAAEADATLPPELSRVNPNKFGLIPNVLFVDFYSWADPADVAIAANARF